ncbi:MAG: enoyl-CoA hydratase/isomerase family protein, partial [Dehalococcoidia bacterium]|nr:enoyl-CoA hydratase/isomerase family protein [Dehalococcoidia bacterium]
MQFITSELENHVATITLNRPEVMNALNREMYAELEQAFRDAHRDPEVRCVLLTGAGRAFCSGDDVKQIMLGEQRDETVARLRDVRPRPTPAAAAVLECDKPVIAAVNGPAVGWGMDLTLFCDIRIASENAKFGELFIKRGLVADIGGLWRLPRVVGPSKAAELLFTGDVIDAREAERIGLVSRVVAAAELLPAAMEVARKIAANPPIAMRYMKEGLRKSAHASMQEMGEYVGNSLAYLFTTEDHKEGAM